jgi:hypothetical protein
MGQQAKNLVNKSKNADESMPKGMDSEVWIWAKAKRFQSAFA